MGYSIPRQQPAVVLRSHFNWLLALLAAALICVGALTIAVGILAGDGDEPTASARGPLPAQLAQTSDEPGARGPLPAQLANSGYDGGPVSRYEGEAKYFVVPSN